MDFTKENFDKLVKKNEEMRKVLTDIINSCCEPKTAVRAVMVNLAPIRKVLED